MDLKQVCGKCIFGFENVCVDGHGILLLKLAKYGIRLKIMVSKGLRKQLNQSSEWRRLPSVGVPQGSVLGPMLFNDLHRVVSDSSVSLYADDTLVYGD